MQHIHLRYLRASTPLFLFALLGLVTLSLGCGKSPIEPAGVKPVPMTLKSVSIGLGAARPLATARTAAFTAADTETIHVDQSDVVLTRALLVVRDVRFIIDGAYDDDDSTGMGGDMMSLFHFAAADTDTTWEDDDDDMGAIIFRGPFVIDLLSRSESSLDTKMVMPGTYHHVQGHLRALHEGDAAATPDLSFLIGATVYLEGEVLGEGGGPFSYEERIDNEFQIRGAFTVEADTPATSFIAFDLGRWLQGQDGRFLDPRVEENHQWIEWAIRHSIKFSIDEDHDGQMDD